MNLRILANALFVGIVCALTSCLDSDYEVTTYDDISISSVKFGTLTRTFHTTTKSGKDSTYVGTYTASSYLIHIDQRNRTIFNADSLPLSTDLTKVFLTITTTNSATPLLMKVEGTDTTYQTMSEKDTLDMSQPRKIRVISHDGKKHADYDISISAHKEYADSFAWSMLAASTELAQLEAVRAVTVGNSVLAMGKENGEVKLYSSDINDGKSWTQVALPAPLSEKARIISVANTLYITDSSSSVLYTSVDGSAFQTITSPDLANISIVVGRHGNTLYGIVYGGLMYASTDNGATWVPSEVSYSDLAYNVPEYAGLQFPTEDINAIITPLVTNKEISRLTVIGNAAGSAVGEGCALIWSRLYDSTVSAQEPWIYQRYAADGVMPLPRLGNLSVASYDDKMLAIGLEYREDSADYGYAKLYSSNDWGLTWRKAQKISLPETMSVASPVGNSSAAIVSDSNRMLWIICGGTGQVWRGRLNGFSWKENQTYFE